jgi:hypothetical protein
MRAGCGPLTSATFKLFPPVTMGPPNPAPANKNACGGGMQSHSQAPCSDDPTLLEVCSSIHMVDPQERKKQLEM